MRKYLLGIDNGNTVSKSTLFDLNGHVIASASSKVQTLYPFPGWSERNMEELWKSNVSNIRKVIKKSGIKPAEIIAVGGTGHGNGLYLIDKFGKPLKAIQSLDSRCGQVVQEWKDSGLQEKVFPFTHQYFWASQTNSLLSWMKRYDSQTYHKIGAVLLCKDYINWCLTGEIATDSTDISATNLFDLKNETYSDELLRLYDLQDIMPFLPKVVKSHDQIGIVSKKAATETGLLPHTPVVAGMLDVQAGMIGSGVIETGQLSVVAGTWSVNSLLMNELPNDPKIAMCSLSALPNNKYLAIEASATSVSNLEWYLNQFGHEERKVAKKLGVSVHQVCDDSVLKCDTPSEVIFHPFLFGSSTHAHLRAGFYGLAGWHSKRDMLRAIYEGIAFSHLSHIEKLTKYRNNGGVILTGGGSKSPVLSQYFSDILGCGIEIPSQQESGTWGAAMAAGIGTGIYANYGQALDKSVRIIKKYESNPKTFESYRSLYKQYGQILDCMR